MGLTANKDDVEHEIKKDQPTASATVNNPDGQTLVVTITTPDAKFKISKDSILQTIGAAVPDLAGAIASGNYQEVLNIVTQNLPNIAALLFGFSSSGVIVPSFKARQTVADGKERCYHCQLDHTVNLKRQPVQLFQFLLANGGKMEFFNDTKDIRVRPAPRATDSTLTVSLTSASVVKTADRDLPYFSSAIIGTQLKQIPTSGATDLLAALTRLLLQDLEAEARLDNTRIVIR